MTPSPTEDAARAAAASLAQAAADGAVPAAALGVWTDGAPVVVEAWGVADVQTGRAATVTTPFSLASVSKPMTGTALALLAARGLVDPDAPVAAVPGARDVRPFHGSGSVTVRQVADHTAGLGTFATFFHADEARAPMSDAETVDRLAVQLLPAGRRWRYANHGYAVLDEVIAAVTGTSYADAMHDLVFGPLGMAGAHLGDGSGDAVAARYGPGGWRYPAYCTGHAGASDVWCSIEDLLRFGVAQLDGSVPAEAVGAMRRASAPVVDGASYGLGWRLRPFPGDLLSLHAGSMGGVTAFLAVAPRSGVVVAALANVETDVVGRAAWSVLEAGVAGCTAPGVPAPLGDTGPKVPRAEVAGSWTGTVHLSDRDEPVLLEVRATGDVLVRVGDLPAAPALLRATTGGIGAVAEIDLRDPLLPDRPHRVHLDLDRVDAHTAAGALVSSGVQDADHPRVPDVISWPVRLHRS